MCSARCSHVGGTNDSITHIVPNVNKKYVRCFRLVNKFPGPAVGNSTATQIARTQARAANTGRPQKGYEMDVTWAVVPPDIWRIFGAQSAAKAQNETSIKVVRTYIKIINRLINKRREYDK